MSKAKLPKSFDVWFVTANTVYRAVPYGVVADWTSEGRLAPTDMVRPAGSSAAWVQVGKHELLIDFVPRVSPAVAVPAEAVPGTVATPAADGAAAAGTAVAAPAQAGPVELPEADELTYRKHQGEEDDDVDMIPLIDVSMVLLVFFILMRAAGATAPIEVPEMKYAGQLTNDPEAITIDIDRKDEEHVEYSVRVGQTPSTEKQSTPEEAIKALDHLLASAQKPPEVRIACHKSLPRVRVYELSRDLTERQKSGKIGSFSATVTEAPEKQK